MARDVAPDGTQLSDERESLLWGFVNMLDVQTQRLDREADRLVPEMRDLQTRAGRLGDPLQGAGAGHRQGQEPLRTPRRLRADEGHGGRGLPGGDRGCMEAQARITRQLTRAGLTSSLIEARDFQRARRDRENNVLLPQGTLVAVAGGKQATDAGAIIRHLDRLKAKYDDVVLVHGGGPGVEKIASRWAERNGVHQIVCKPDWDAHGRAALRSAGTTSCWTCCPRG